MNDDTTNTPTPVDTPVAEVETPATAPVETPVTAPAPVEAPVTANQSV